MSREYAPDKWQIVRIKGIEGEAYKVLGSWYGGYAGSDSWRLSSGITKITESDMCYTVLNESGSMYTLYKGVQGMSGYTYGIYKSLKDQETESLTINVIDIADITEKFA
jgi:hypothetical protein